ncbi:VOC family protein [Paenibacillus sp. NEAU-GSW1]|uniref:VOC family protein n=1 Tax=Paenibacillus sp. NEAU-GSW1 TaxID=2682486 RepID=UPI0012E25E60|nr:VOC family protein [Paenibacillus sp. NEAU-GSW1]MUT65376.1 hypothetical protein [Paenibacillus sp. NEAU-GSW1]
MNLFFNGKVVIWLHVRNFEEAVEWYKEYLGLPLADNMGDIVFFRLNDDQTKLALVKSDLENPKTHAVLDLQSDNIKKTYQLLKGRGVRVDDLDNPYWVYHEFHLYDLEGNKLKIHGFSNDSNEHA